jgi:hypothetical protein
MEFNEIIFFVIVFFEELKAVFINSGQMKRASNIRLSKSYDDSVFGMGRLVDTDPWIFGSGLVVLVHFH